MRDEYMDEQALIYASPMVREQSASVVQIESSKLLPLVVLLSILCGLSIGLTAFAFSAARNADRESRMLEYYVMELDGKLMKSGLLDPKDSYSANKR